MLRFAQALNQILIRLKPYRWLLFGLLSLVASLGVFGPLNGLLDSFIAPHPQCSWRPAPGTVTGSDLRNHVRPNGEDDWQFTVKFTYDVGRSRHSAQQQLQDFLVVGPDVPKFAEVPYLFQACADLPSLKEAVALFRAAHDTSQFFPGRPVIVYFNPANSAEAVLVPGLVLGAPMSYGEVIAVYAFLALLFGGIIMLIKGIIALRHPSAA